MVLHAVARARASRTLQSLFMAMLLAVGASTVARPEEVPIDVVSRWTDQVCKSFHEGGHEEDEKEGFWHWHKDVDTEVPRIRVGGSVRHLSRTTNGLIALGMLPWIDVFAKAHFSMVGSRGLGIALGNR